MKFINFQINLLDTIAGLEGAIKKYRNAFKLWQTAKEHYESLLGRRQKALQEEDYQKFVLEELNTLNLDHLDQDQLEQTILRRMKSLEIKISSLESQGWQIQTIQNAL